MYVARLDPAGGLEELRIVPLQSRRMRLRLATDQDGRWLQQAMRESRLLLLDGNFFLPTRELCRQAQLTGACATACKRYNLRVP